MDGGDPPKTGSAEVVIKLEDVDDNVAVFSDATYQFSVAENSAVGSLVGTVTGVDIDLPPYNLVYYYLSGDEARGFHINPHNGQSSVPALPSIFVTNRIFTS